MSLFQNSKNSNKANTEIENIDQIILDPSNTILIPAAAAAATSTHQQQQQQQQQQTIQKQSSSLRRSKFDYLPFWINDPHTHRSKYNQYEQNDKRCCFNHYIGLPRKLDGDPSPIYDYELDLVNALDNNKSVFVKKARGLGITEILLRYMAWRAICFNDLYSGCRFHIVTGPRINLAEELIDRVYSLFKADHLIDIYRSIKRTGTTLIINNVTFQSFPSRVISSMRGYTDVKFILIDECAFFPQIDQSEVRAVVEGYRAKTKPSIVLVSTPYRPMGYFYDVDREEEKNSIFKKLSFHYSVGLDKIYDSKTIQEEKTRLHFRREFELAYSVGTGNVFIESSIQKAEQLGIQYRESPINNPYTIKSMGIDLGYGSSKTTFVILEYIDNNIIRVIHSEEFEHSSTDEMAKHADKLIRKYGFLNKSNKVFVDGSAAGYIRSLKTAIGEYPHYELQIERSKKDKIPLYHMMQIIPVSFGEEGTTMLEQCKKMIELNRVAIDPLYHENLLTEIRLATSTEDLKLDKHDFPMDLLDAFRLAMKFVVSST